MILAIAALALAPWSGPNLAASASAQAKYRLTISAPARSSVHLRAENVAKGWIAAFCNGRVCSPNQVTQDMPASGKIAIQFELIREEATAPKTSGATIKSDDGAKITLSP